ncbi:Uncharacterised protein [Bordetella pertussis]|nr:Uncharacterised protein [Bordetella pertussis]
MRHWRKRRRCLIVCIMRIDGVVFPENVARFDAAFDALRIAVGEAADDDETAVLAARKEGDGNAN